MVHLYEGITMDDYDIIGDIIEDDLQSEPHTLWDINYLYSSFRKAFKSSSWKGEPQEFEINFLSELVKISNELQSHIYRPDQTIEFVLNERGKVRYIHGNTIRDRIVRHNLCDNIINPMVFNKIIYNNGASQKGKGMSFSRSQFERHLHNFFIKNKSNNGYIMFIDFSKFYDNIPHNELRRMFEELLDSEAMWLLNLIIQSFNIDITQFPTINPDDKFDSIAFHDLIAEEINDLPTRMLDKGIDIGDQTSQTIGIFYPTRIDTYATLVRHHKWYGRYMDDIYIIHESKEYLEETYAGIVKLCKELGLYINEKKTHICKLSDTFKYLQIKYTLTDTGKVIKRINPKSITRERRKLKAYKRLLDNGVLQYEDIEQAYKSWICQYYKIMSKEQINNMQNLYKELFGKEVRYKK